MIKEIGYVIKIETNGAISIEEVDGAGEKVFLKQLQDMVAGYIELANVLLPGKYRLVVDEEGLLKGLAHNLWASKITGCNIFGTAVIVKRVADDIAPFESKAYVNKNIMRQIDALLS